MKKHFKWVFIILILTVCLIYTGLHFSGYSFEFVKELLHIKPTEEELLEKIPRMDPTKYNRFTFTAKVTAGNAEGDVQEFTESGPLEIYRDITHLYNQEISVTGSDKKSKEERWTNFKTKEQYKDVGSGWVLGQIKSPDGLNNLRNAINNREKERILNRTDSVCTLSWQFDADVCNLFQEHLSGYTDDLNLSGYGRATAVFDPKTYEFQYFTFIISANNEQRSGALLDTTFYWEVQNDDTKGLSIPSDIAKTAYEHDTGVIINGGYDSVVNPLAEDLIEAYGGKAETTHNEAASSLFWTNKKDGIAATINYMRTDKKDACYKENYEFLSAFYKKLVEETDTDAYFYDSSSGELTYIAKGKDWYAEIIVTGKSGTSQGELRKTLITYKSKLNI